MGKIDWGKTKAMATRNPSPAQPAQSAPTQPAQSVPTQAGAPQRVSKIDWEATRRANGLLTASQLQTQQAARDRERNAALEAADQGRNRNGYASMAALNAETNGASYRAAAAEQGAAGAPRFADHATIPSGTPRTNPAPNVTAERQMRIYDGSHGWVDPGALGVPGQLQSTLEGGRGRVSLRMQGVPQAMQYTAEGSRGGAVASRPNRGGSGRVGGGFGTAEAQRTTDYMALQDEIAQKRDQLVSWRTDIIEDPVQYSQYKALQSEIEDLENRRKAMERETPALKGESALDRFDRTMQGVVDAVFSFDPFQPLDDWGREMQTRMETGGKAENGKNASIGDIIGGAIITGMADFNKQVASGLDFLIPTDFLGEYDPFSALNDLATENQAALRARQEYALDDRSQAAKTASEIGSGTVAALPQAITALLSLPAAGIQSTAALAPQASGLASSISRGVRTISRNPGCWQSFITTVGGEYEDAAAQGGEGWAAALAAIVSSMANSVVEVGGGIQTLPGNLQNPGTSALLEWFKSGLDEGKEEVIQSLISGITQKALVNGDKPVFSMTDEDAIINPLSLAEDFGMGAAVGWTLGGGEALLTGALNRQARKENAGAENAAQAEAYAPPVPEAQEAAPYGTEESRYRPEPAVIDAEGAMQDAALWEAAQEAAMQQEGSPPLENAGQNSDAAILHDISMTNADQITANTTSLPAGILSNLSRARTYFLDFAGRHFPKRVTVRENGKTIDIPRKGLSKLMNGVLSKELYTSAFHVPALLEAASRTGQAESYHQDPNIPTYEYYDSAISVDGMEYVTHIRVKNTNMGDKYYGHTIRELDRIKIEPSLRTSAVQGQTVQPGNADDSMAAAGDASLTTSSIPQDAGSVKGETYGQEAALLQKYADAFGESGKRAMLAAYTPGQNAAAFYAGFAAQYQAGLTGQDSAKARTGNLTRAQQYAAYTAGQNDAAASLRREKAAAQPARPGVLVQNEQAKAIPREQAGFLDRLAREVGVHIELTESIADEAGNPGAANGVYLPERNTVRIAMDADQPLMTVAAHEITHYLQDTAPEAYRAYRDYANRALSERLGTAAVEEAMQRYAAHGQELTVEQAMDEVAAEFAEAMARDGRLFENLARENRRIARRVLDALKAFLEKVRRVFSGSRAARNSEAMRVYGVDMETLETAAKLWQRAYDAAGSAQGTENAANVGGEVRYSFRETERLTTDDLDAYLNTGTRRNQGKKAALARGEDIILTSDSKISSYIRRAVAGENLPTAAYGRVSERLADEIQRVSGGDTDVHGAYLEFVASDLKHAYNGHLAAKEDGDLSLTENDFLLVPAYLDAYDEVLEVRKYKDGSTRVVLSCSLENGKLIMVEVVSSSRNALQLKSMYAQTIEKHERIYGRKREAVNTGGDAKRPFGIENDPLTPRDTASADTIPQSGGEVNTQFDAVGGEARYSIKYDRDNTPYVEVENDILEGVPEDQRVKTVKENLRRKFPDGITIGNNVVKITGKSRGEMTYSAYMRQILRQSPQLYTDKLRSTDSADEILHAAQDWVNESLFHPRNDDIMDFARGTVQIRVGGNDYTASVIVGNQGKNGLLLYDIIDLSPTKIRERIKKAGAAETAAPSSEEGHHDRQTAPVGDSISKNGGEVNSQFDAAGGARYSIKNTQHMSLAEQLKAYYDGRLKSSDSLYFGTTPETLSVAGLDRLPLAFTATDFEKSTKKKHNVPRRVLKALRGDLETAMFVFQDGNRVGVLTADIDGDGKPLLVAIEKNATMDRKPVNAIRSVYGLDNPASWLKNQINSGKKFAILDEKKANTFLQTYGYSASVGEGIRSLNANLTQPGEEVNGKFSLKGGLAYLEEAGRIQEQAQKAGWSDAQLREALHGAVDRMLQSHVEKYGSIPAGENPARTVQVPKRTAAGEKVSRTVRTILEAKATPEEAIPSIRELVAKGDFSYETITDRAAIARAEETVTDRSWNRTMRDWERDMNAGRVNKDNTALGWALYNHAANAGDLDAAMDVLQHMVRSQRSAAQALQATRILKKLSPEAQLYGAAQSVEGLQRELNERYGGGKAPELKIDPELGERLLAAEDQKGRDAALREIYRDIGRQLPARFRDKWNAWRYLSMLGNPRTHVRNLVGNAGFAPVVAVKDLAATGIEKAVHAVSGGRLERSKGLAGLGKLLPAAWADYANVEEAALGGGKYGDLQNANRYIEEGRRIFPGRNPVSKALEAARRANSYALDREDVWFSKPHYAFALAQFCAAHRITEAEIRKGNDQVLAAARNYAIREAQKATYRDANALSQAISALGKDHSRGRNPVGKALGTVMEGILPFRKTPANILARGLEYSPLGLLKGISYDLTQVHRGNMTGAEAIDNISAGLTGTGLLGLGVWLAAEGLVRGLGAGDDRERELERLQGHQDYALELRNGTSITLDWLAPEALPFFVGVNLWEATHGSGQKATLSQVLNAVGNVSEPMLEMSCLQSLNDVLESGSRLTSDGLGALPAALASAATSYLTQALPTLLGQIERTGEAERETTYTGKSAFLTEDIQYLLGKVSGKIPFWEYQQIPYIDAWGRHESNGSTGERALGSFINPAYTSKIEESPVEDELLRLYKETGEAGVLPSRAEKYFMVDGESRDLTAQEYVRYAEKKGQTALKLVSDLTEWDGYKNLEDGVKTECVKDAYTYANQSARHDIDRRAKEAAWVQKARTGEETHGIPVSVYILLRNEVNDMESLKDEGGDPIAYSKSLLVMQAVYSWHGLTDAQREYLFEAFEVGGKVIAYNRAAVDETLQRMRAKQEKAG